MGKLEVENQRLSDDLLQLRDVNLPDFWHLETEAAYNRGNGHAT